MVVRGSGDISNASNKILTNITVNAATPSLTLTNLTAEVTYTVTASAATRAGAGPPSAPATLRLDPASRLLLKDQHHRYLHLFLLFIHGLFNYALSSSGHIALIGRMVLKNIWKKSVMA